MIDKDFGIGIPRQSDDLPALAYVPPVQANISSTMLLEENSSRTIPKANGVSPFGPDLKDTGSSRRLWCNRIANKDYPPLSFLHTSILAALLI